MNIFYLHHDPKVCAAMHCDKHVVKMIIETAQLLSTAHHILGNGATYKRTHEHHPSAKWVRESAQNYHWAFMLYQALLTEYSARYHRTHASARLYGELSETPKGMPKLGFTPPPQCMPEQYQNPNDPIAAYRAYYIHEKGYMARWAHSAAPEWWPLINK